MSYKRHEHENKDFPKGARVKYGTKTFVSRGWNYLDALVVEDDVNEEKNRYLPLNFVKADKEAK